ncbi:MAG: hypothetical protein U9N59_01495 [Campylobacterota bacterium]|nr:hypothetical protein [Campylobacterota bacterium]
MLKIIVSSIIISQALLATNGVYQSSIYAMCDSKSHLDDWTQFDVDGDTASKRAYYGSKCFVLQKDIAVSGVKHHWGKVSFTYGGYTLWGYREGIK